MGLLSALMVGWLALFCDQCLDPLEAAPPTMETATHSCCVHGNDANVAEMDPASMCAEPQHTTCAMAAAMEPDTALVSADLKLSPHQLPTVLPVAFAGVDHRPIGQAEAAPVVISAELSFYDPRRLERVRLLLI